MSPSLAPFPARNTSTNLSVNVQLWSGRKLKCRPLQISDGSFSIWLLNMNFIVLELERSHPHGTMVAIRVAGLRDVGQMRVFARLALGLALPARFFAPPPAFAPYQMEHSSYHLFHSQFLKHFVRNCIIFFTIREDVVIVTRTLSNCQKHWKFIMKTREE